MINVDKNKIPNSTKSAVISKFKRLPVPQASPQVTARQPADAASEFDAGKDGAELVPHSAAGDNGPPPAKDVDVPGGGAERVGVFSPGKIVDPGDPEVANYIGHIGQAWRRSVHALMEVARLCAEANERLTTAQKSGLLRNLPFRLATFSKFVQIGSDTRLYAPEIQRLLPAHYTTTYAVTLLTDDELKQAVAEKILHPDMKRDKLQRWRKSRNLGHLPSPHRAACDPGAVSPPATSTRGAAVSGALPSTIGDDSQDNQDELAAAPKYAVATAKEIAGSVTPPPNDDEIPAFLDRRPLSPDDQRAFDGIMTALNNASAVVRERVKADLIRANVAWSGSAAKAISSRRHEDDASATPSPPTASVVSADAAERAEVGKPDLAGEAPPGVAPEAMEDADAGIKHSDTNVPGFTTIHTNFVVVRPKRRRGRKVPGPLENSPF